MANRQIYPPPPRIANLENEKNKMRKFKTLSNVAIIPLGETRVASYSKRKCKERVNKREEIKRSYR